MGQIICILSQKGGVGKTTTAVNLSAAFAVAEKDSLLVDCDPQGHATAGLGFDKNRIRYSLYHAMTGKVRADDLLMESRLKGLKILPARTELIRVEPELMARDGKENILSHLLENFRETFDYIVIDSPPSFNLLTVNAITAADLLLIPLQCEFYALEALGTLLKSIRVLKRRLNPRLEIAGILLTMFEGREEICRKIANQVRDHFRDIVFKTVIPRSVHLREAPTHGSPLLLTNIRSSGAQCYLKLAQEFMGKWSLAAAEPQGISREKGDIS